MINIQNKFIRWVAISVFTKVFEMGIDEENVKGAKVDVLKITRTISGEFVAIEFVVDIVGSIVVVVVDIVGSIVVSVVDFVFACFVVAVVDDIVAGVVVDIVFDVDASVSLKFESLKFIFRNLKSNCIFLKKI